MTDASSIESMGFYAFDGDSDFMTDLEHTVLESLLEKESFDATTFYSFTISAPL